MGGVGRAGQGREGEGRASLPCLSLQDLLQINFPHAGREVRRAANRWSPLTGQSGQFNKSSPDWE